MRGHKTFCFYLGPCNPRFSGTALPFEGHQCGFVGLGFFFFSAHVVLHL